MIDLTHMSDDELLRHASDTAPTDTTEIAARALQIFRDGKDATGQRIDPSNAVGIHFGNRDYIGLARGRLLYAVYRRQPDGRLRRMRRIPLTVCASIILNAATDPSVSQDPKEPLQ